jgi:hypothetical protein
MRLVEVPIRVMTPPSTAANDRGISSREALTPWRRDHCSMLGIMSATSGVLGTNPDPPAATRATRRTARRSVLGARAPSTPERARESAPVCSAAPATT